MSVPQLAVLDILKRKDAAHSELPHNGSFHPQSDQRREDQVGGLPLVEIPYGRHTRDPELDLGSGAVGIDRRHDISAVRGIGGTQESTGDLQGAPLRHGARTVVGQLGRLIGGSQLDGDRGRGTGRPIAIGHRVLERVLGRGPIGIGENLYVARVHITQLAAGQFGLSEGGVRGQIAPGRGRLAIGPLQLAVGGQHRDRVSEGRGVGVGIGNGDLGGTQVLDVGGLASKTAGILGDGEGLGRTHWPVVHVLDREGQGPARAAVQS